ncbi:MAG: hypothetical protein R3C58_06455 [Parvularculaceae bacterium]
MAQKLDHLTILSRSVEESERFYGALLPLLGFRQTKRGIWTDDDGFFFQFLPAKPETRAYERYGPGLNHLGFGAPDRAYVNNVRDRMIAAGFDIQPVQELGGAYALFMPDPDGLRIELTHYPEGVAVVD